MTKQNRPRMRHFARAGSQQHITSGDHYLYKTPEPFHRLAIVGTGTIGQEHMRVANLLGRARIHDVFDIETHSVEAVKLPACARKKETQLLPIGAGRTRCRRYRARRPASCSGLTLDH